jgi:hypothetical protein
VHLLQFPRYVDKIRLEVAVAAHRGCCCELFYRREDDVRGSQLESLSVMK